MKQIKNFDEARTLLETYVPRSVEESYTLVRMKQLMTALGNPQNSYKVVHIAGTSGKTSTAYYMSALLHQVGKKVGLTVSPHIDEVNERLQINLKPLDEASYCQALSEFIALVERTGLSPTYFELLVAFAYWEFARQKVEYAVVEVGLGGLLDGTNVINREDKVCVITDIGLDHTHILGETIAEISAQKAGIIQTHNAVITHQQGPEVMKVIEAKSQKVHARLVVVKGNNIISQHLPEFQRRNWTLAYATWQYLARRDDLKNLSADRLTRTTQTYIPARIEIIQMADKTLILDGAHNGQKMQALVSTITERFSGKKSAVLLSLSVGKSKLIGEVLHELQTITSNITLTSFDVGQDIRHTAIAPEDIARVARQIPALKVTIIANPEEAYRHLLLQPEEILLVTGSFYLLSHLRPTILRGR